VPVTECKQPHYSTVDVDVNNGVKCECIRNVVRVTTCLRHILSTVCTCTFGSFNVRSLSPSKLDDLFLVTKGYRIVILLLCETWLDADSVYIDWLRTDDCNVIEYARPLRVDGRQPWWRCHRYTGWCPFKGSQRCHSLLNCR